MSLRNNMSRITIDIPKEAHRRLKAVAAIEGRSMREIVIESIEDHIYGVNIPNEETLKAIEETEKGKGLVKAKNLEDLFKKLGI